MVMVALKVTLPNRGITNALTIWTMIANLSSSMMTLNKSVAVCASYNIDVRYSATA